MRREWLLQLYSTAFRLRLSALRVLSAKRPIIVASQDCYCMPISNTTQTVVATVVAVRDACKVLRRAVTKRNQPTQDIYVSWPGEWAVSST